MKAEDILNLPAMPLPSPSYPRGPYRVIGREYLVITCESDPECIRFELPEHLVPHVNAPVAELPVKQVIGAVHIIADFALFYGRVLHDYKSG